MNKDDRKVSVIIPAYNAENSLGVCIDSALGQTLKPCQVLVINDGSTDTTGEIARGYGDKITYIEQENLGQGAARNKGLQFARGKYIAFLDADDYWLGDFLDTCVAFLEKHKDLVAVSTGIRINLLDRSEHILPPCIRGRDGIDKPIVVDDFFKFWAEQDHVRTGSNLIRKAVIDEAGYQRADLRVSQDLEYWGFIATFGKWGFIPEPLWVGNSRTAAATSGWLKKYRLRRSLCPTVEAWERRIVPRLKHDEIASFQIVRGRVAVGYAHAKILAGDFEEAFDIVQKYGASMPRNRLTSLLHKGASLGEVGWFIVCLIVRLRDFFTAWRPKVRRFWCAGP